MVDVGLDKANGQWSISRSRLFEEPENRECLGQITSLGTSAMQLDVINDYRQSILRI